jgi:hypothetical protein
LIVLKFYSFDLNDKQFFELAKLIAEHFNMRGYPLALSADPLRGRQLELILTPPNMPLTP